MGDRNLLQLINHLTGFDLDISLDIIPLNLVFFLPLPTQTHTTDNEIRLEVAEDIAFWSLWVATKCRRHGTENPSIFAFSAKSTWLIKIYFQQDLRP